MRQASIEKVTTNGLITYDCIIARAIRAAFRFKIKVGNNGISVYEFIPNIS